MRPLDRAKIFTRVSRGCFSRGSYGMATRRRGCVVGRTWVSTQKIYNFWSDRWIALKFLQGFPEVVFLGVAIAWQLGDEDVLSVEIEYRITRATTFWCDRWIALNFLLGFPEAVFPGVDMEWLLGDEDVWSVELEYRLKRAITFYPSVGSRSNFYKGFQRLFSLG